MAAALRAAGHDVRAAGEERDPDGGDDEELLEPAAREGRIFVTFDVADFPRITSEWAAGGRPHAGCAIVVGIGTDEFGLVLERLAGAFGLRPDATAWRDYTGWVTRAG